MKRLKSSRERVGDPGVATSCHIALRSRWSRPVLAVTSTSCAPANPARDIALREPIKRTLQCRAFVRAEGGNRG